MNEQQTLSAVAKIPQEQLLTLPYFQNRGSKFLRALVNDNTGKRELAFSDTIKKFQEGHGSSLEMIVGENPVAVEAALTTFQWLATNVGACTLEDALAAIGKKIVDA